MATLTVYSEVYSLTHLFSMLYETVYLNAARAASASSTSRVGSHVHLAVQTKTSSYYLISQSFIAFDTSQIGASAEIEDVELSAVVMEKVYPEHQYDVMQARAYDWGPSISLNTWRSSTILPNYTLLGLPRCR